MSIRSQAYFTPTSITGCALWYDAADPLGTGTAPSSGTTITSWKDKSGNANDATGQVSAATGSDSVGAFLNFQGTNYYTIGSGAFIVNKYFTIFIVERLQSSGVPGAYQHHFIGNTTPGPINGALHLRYANTTSIFMGYYGNDIGSGNVISAFTTVEAQPDRMFTFNQLSSGRNIYINSSNVASDANTTLLNGWASPVIGQSFSGYYYVGKMREMIFYTGELSTAQRQQVEGYLAQKWGLQGSLPGSHPGILFPFYKSVKNPVRTQIYSTLFYPTQIPGCQLWLDAADATKFTFSSVSNISGWLDKSPSANNMTTISGTPVYTTDGTLSVVNIPSGALLQTSAYFTITTSSAFFVVAKLTSTATNYPMLITLIDNNSGDYSIRYSGSVVNFGNADDIGNGNYYTNGSPNVNASFLNQYVIIDTTTATRAATSRVAVSGTFSSRYFIGNVCEVIIYPGGVSSTQRSQLQSYLAQKWGLISVLPGSHLQFTQPAGLPAVNSSVLRVLTYVGNTNLSGINYFNVGQNYWTSYYQPYLQALTLTNASATSQTIGGGITGSGPGSAGYFGGVLAPNGNIYCIPCNSTSVAVINLSTNALTSPVSGTAPGSVAYYGGVLAPNGMIYCIPANATSIGMINPITNTFSLPVSGSASGGSAYFGGVLAPNGKIYCIPYNATTIGVIDPLTNTFTSFGTAPGGGAYQGGVLAPNGKIYCVPSTATSIGVIDPATNTFSTFGSVPLVGSGTYNGGALGPNGMIYFIPKNSPVIGMVNPTTNTYSTFGTVPSTVEIYYGGILAPNGYIYCLSQNGGVFARIDTRTNTFATISGTVPGGGGYYGGVLAPNGIIYVIPCNATTVATITISGLTQLPSLTYCLSAYANKF